MSLMVDPGRTPVHWPGQKFLPPKTLANHPDPMAGCLQLALVNNMPDAAIEDTEEQFFELLNSAADGLPIHLALYSLPKIARSDRAQDHLDNFYRSTTELLGKRLDGVIITGTEPRQPDLRNEPYWGPLVELMEWAEENTTSTVLSCLAAHAGVLHTDGIGRTPLDGKRFGVFAHQKDALHPLTSGTPDAIRIPHSRWNEVREDALLSCGYSIVTKSPEAGVDLFVKQKKKCLFVHFQGHPEYVADTLHKEYRRDVKRFLRRERENYPSVPAGYFNAQATTLLNEFQQQAFADRREDIMEQFPEAEVSDSLQNSWRSSAALIYRNWLQHLALRKADAPTASAMARVGLG
jgi:homoserine O-succinyltransferase/O-acetyltransferase